MFCIITKLHVESCFIDLQVLRSTAIEEKDGKLCVSGSDWAQSQDVGLQEALHAAIKVKAEYMLTHTCRLTGECNMENSRYGNCIELDMYLNCQRLTTT